LGFVPRHVELRDDTSLNSRLSSKSSYSVIGRAHFSLSDSPPFLYRLVLYNFAVTATVSYYRARTFSHFNTQITKNSEQTQTINYPHNNQISIEGTVSLDTRPVTRTCCGDLNPENTKIRTRITAQHQESAFNDKQCIRRETCNLRLNTGTDRAD